MNTVSDKELIAMATAVIRQRFRPGYHHVGSALITRKGQVFTGVHLEAHVGRIAVCAEAIALGAAATSGDTEIERIVAVNDQGEVVPPCGMCRELISDYAPKAMVLLKRAGSVTRVPVGELLPDKYQR